METWFGGGIQESNISSWTWATCWHLIATFPWIPALYTGIFSTSLCLWVEVQYLVFKMKCLFLITFLLLTLDVCKGCSFSLFEVHYFAFPHFLFLSTGFHCNLFIAVVQHSNYVVTFVYSEFML